MTLLCSGHCPGWVAGAGPGWNYAVRSSSAESGQLQQHLANLLIISTLVTRSQVNTDPPSVKPSHSLSLPSPAHHTIIPPPPAVIYTPSLLLLVRPSIRRNNPTAIVFCNESGYIICVIFSGIHQHVTHRNSNNPKASQYFMVLINFAYLDVAPRAVFS